MSQIFAGLTDFGQQRDRQQRLAGEHLPRATSATCSDREPGLQEFLEIFG
jgi:hypothetical protein